MRSLASVVIASSLLTFSSPERVQQPAPATPIQDTGASPAPPATPPPQSRGRGATPEPSAPPSRDASAPQRGDSLPSPAVNVKLDLVITDTYTGSPSTKTVSLVIANGGNGWIRTSNRLPDGNPVNLNIDAHARVFSSNVISIVITFQYTPAQSSQPDGKPATRPADLFENVSVLLQDGKSTVVSQSADPATDRKVTAQITASIVK